MPKHHKVSRLANVHGIRVDQMGTAADSAHDREILRLENQRRYWKIEGFGQVPCGGTHVKSTKEVGYITLKRKRSGKKIERIEIRLTDE